MAKVFNSNVSKSDIFYTPDWIVDLLVPYIPKNKYFWECAFGEGNISSRLAYHKLDGCASDITSGIDFLTQTISQNFDIIITNPPFSLKDKFIERCIEYKKLFALLLPISSLEGKTRSKLWQQCEDLSVIIPDKRVNFIGQSGSPNFCSAWFCNGFNLGKQIIFVNS